MARMKKQSLTPDRPSALEIKLFKPGMTPLHRAGLGGLACTLRYIERAYGQGVLSDDDVPGGPWANPDVPPWSIDADKLTLQFGDPSKAEIYLKRLFALGFQVKEGIIFLPGQYGVVPPSLAIRCAVQLGIQTTFLQHGPTCGSRSGERTVTVEVDNAPYQFSHDVFTSYKHQGWFWLDKDETSDERDPETNKKLKTGRRVKNHQSPPFVTKDGTLSYSLHELDIKVLPGTMIRHNQFKSTAAVETDAGLICLHFALVGTLALPVNAAKAVMLIPEVFDLRAFSKERWVMTPTGLRDSRVAGGPDAALQMQVRLHARSLGINGFHALTFLPTAWAKQQKSRVNTMYVPSLPTDSLDLFELALAHLPPRIVTKVDKATVGRGKSKITVERPVAYRTDSVVRPFVAENLALGRPWYAGFTRLMTAINPATDRPYRYAIQFEQGGLAAMVNDARAWAGRNKGEQLVVQAVHAAIRFRLRKIKEYSQSNKDEPPTQATINRWGRFRERLRLDLAGAKTASQARFALTDLFSRGSDFDRGGYNSVLQLGWAQVLPVLYEDWQLARDLGLLGLASYGARKKPKTNTTTTEE